MMFLLIISIIINVILIIRLCDAFVFIKVYREQYKVCYNEYEKLKRGDNNE